MCFKHGFGLRKIEGSTVLWNCKLRGAQHIIVKKIYDFRVAQEQKLGTRGHWALLELSPGFRVLNNLAPSYLVVLLPVYEPARCPNRSSSDKWQFVIEPYNLKTYGLRALSVIVPILWNDLPIDIRSIDDVNKFDKFQVEDLSLNWVHELSKDSIFLSSFFLFLLQCNNNMWISPGVLFLTWVF